MPSKWQVCGGGAKQSWASSLSGGILLLFLLKGMRGICGEAVAEKLALDADSGVKCPQWNVTNQIRMPSFLPCWLYWIFHFDRRQKVNWTRYAHKQVVNMQRLRP
jgi:hypothetical protein